MNQKEDCCEKCGGTNVENVNPSYEDKRVTINLWRCVNCKEIQLMFISFSDDLSFTEGLRIRDEMTKKYGLDAVA